MLTDEAKVIPGPEPAQAPPSSPGCSVCAVTITYGMREQLLRPVLLALLKEPSVWKIVVVSNAARWDVRVLASELAPGRIEVLEMGSNRGSSAAYAAGIKRACEVGTDFIWLLDDDNEPQEGALSELLSAHGRLNEEFPRDKLAVFGFRPLHHQDILTGWYRRRRPSSFWSFHVFDTPYKLWRRARRLRPRMRRALPFSVEMGEGPFGGLLFHRAVVERHGLPREDFVLYADDLEFTYRISSDGGALRLVPSAALADLDLAWPADRRFGRGIYAWLVMSSDARVFYGARNQSYLDSHCYPHNRLMFWINRRVFCLVLWVLALVSRRTGRYRLVQSAIRDGLEGHLGVRPEYPL